ncbi:MAG TPA: hypothetical protein VLD67_09890 [Vicinamibacterales bacterium]|nr:hypothetical protein [Vicinamibacterales bacterium]
MTHSADAGARAAGTAAARLISPGALAALLFLVVAGSAALAVGTTETFGIKGDESTYVAMALSLGRDGDLHFDRRDLQRFISIYGHGPEGLFLKKGRSIHPRLVASWPFVVLERHPVERLYFGKAFLYAWAAAPLAFLAGVNGLFLFNVLLLAVVLAAGYAFLVSHSAPLPSVLFVTAFGGASVAVLYTVWLTPEILNFALVFVAYFLWLYKETVPPGRRVPRWLFHPGTDFAAAALLGLATYSKPPNLLLIAPLVLWHWWRRRVVAGLGIGLCFGAFVAGGFALTAMVAGDWNYQGGERKTFYGSFPYESRAATFDTTGLPMATDDLSDDESLEREVFWPRLLSNAGYFLAGRHFGFIPYYFPGAVALVLSLIALRRTTAWRMAILAAVGATVIVMLIQLPFSWSGGGGPPGNRYFLSVYPALFFAVPALKSIVPGLVAWAGGAVFIAHIVLQPVYASKFPWVTSQRGLLRLLPVELTMADDLPVRLTLTHARLHYGDPPVLLYLIDEHAFAPEPAGIWVAGAARADILIRSADQPPYLRVELESPIANEVRLSAGSGTRRVRLEPGRIHHVQLPVEWIRARPGSGACLLSIRTSDGFVPRLNDPDSQDSRYLGALIRFTVAEAPDGTTAE